MDIRLQMKDKQEKGYHKLLLWKRLKEFIKLTYRLVDKLPHEENFGLKLQMKRCVVSVISNFVEGYLKTSQKHKLSFLEISNTSLQELEAQAEICLILGYWTDDDFTIFDEKRGEIGYLLFRYTKTIKETSV